MPFKNLKKEPHTHTQLQAPVLNAVWTLTPARTKKEIALCRFLSLMMMTSISDLVHQAIVASVMFALLQLVT